MRDFEGFRPVKEDDLLTKYHTLLSNNPENISFNIQDFKCPLSGKVFVSDAVVLHGYVYERDALEDWIF